MKRYREGLASRGVKQVQVNLPDAMLDWLDQFAAEQALSRSAMIEVLCRAGASHFQIGADAQIISRSRLRSTLQVVGNRPGNSISLWESLLESVGTGAHLLYLTPTAGIGRQVHPIDNVICDWSAATPVVQGQRFNPIAANVLPERAENRRTYVRWIAQTLAPERGDVDAAFPDSTRQLLEETILALLTDHQTTTIEEIADTIEAMPWTPPRGPVPGAPNKRVIELLTGQNRGLLPFAERDEKSLIGVVEAARDALAPFRTPELRRLCAFDDSLLARFDGSPVAIQIANAVLGTPASRLAVMFVAAVIASRLQTRPYTFRTPIIIALEEVGSLPRVPGIEEALSVGHRHGLWITASAQNFRQIEARYGEATALAIRAAAESVTIATGAPRLSVV
jgi:hypothetical protein